MKLKIAKKVAKIQMFRWMCGHMLKDKSENISPMLDVLDIVLLMNKRKSTPLVK